MPRALIPGTARTRVISVSFLLSMLIVMNVGLMRLASVEAAGTRIYLDPPASIFHNDMHVEDRFNVTVWLENAPDLGAYQIYMEFNDSIINATRRFEPTWNPQYIFYNKTTTVVPGPPDPGYARLSQGKGRILVASGLFPYPPGQQESNGTGMLCILEFKITAVPTYPETKLASDIWIDNQNDTYLLDGDTNQISGVTLMNGYYEIDYGTTGTFIRPDGSFDPPTSFITTSDNVTYTFTGNITDSIVVERNNIVVNGARYTLYGNNSGVGITIGGRSNVTIKSVQIRAFRVGIELRYYSTAISMIENDIENCKTGIQLEASDCNAILGNNVTNNGMGVFIQESSCNNVSGNWIQANDYQGVQIGGWSGSASHNTISSNRIQYNSLDGIALNYSAHANSILENEIVGNGRYGVEIILGENNSIFHNNFIDNTAGQAYVYDCPNFWNNDYPYGGNYWNTYFNKTDLFRGVTQNENGSDGIADDPYIVDANNTDYYPLMGPFGSSTMAGANVTVFPTDGVDLTFDTVTVAGSTTAIEFAAGPSPPSDWFSVGSFYDVTTTASYSGNTTVRIVYDDSNLTLTQEMSLRLERWDATTAALYDVNGDWKEDAKDVYRVGKAYGTTLEGPNPPGRKYDPPCDFNHDGKIDMKDYYMVQKYYGQPTGTWVTITTYVDTANNVIYGETSHFSGIGIHYFR